MGRRKQEIIWPHLCDGGGKLEATWYVEYSIRNPVTGKMERLRHYDGFRDIDTPKGRQLYAKKIIRKITADIRNGNTGFEAEIEYEDMLGFGGGQSRFAKKKKTFAGSVNLYLSGFLKYKMSEINTKSLESYRSKLRIFKEFLDSKKMSDKPVLLINNDLIIEFLKALVEDKALARKTIEKYQQILHTFFRHLIENKKIDMPNPALNIPRMGLIKDYAAAGIPGHMRKRLTALIEKADPQLWMACCFIYYTAIRPGTELRLMKLKQINFDAHTITIYNYLAKNQRTEIVDIPDQLFDLMERWGLRDYDPDLYLLGKKGLPDTEPLGKNTMRIRFNAFRDRLKLPKSIKYYSWKHSGAQELADQGLSIYELQRHLRHRDIATTEMYLKKRIGQRSNNIRHNFPEI
jgi:integrase